MKKSILLVEDDQNDVELSMRALESHGMGWRVSIARDGAEALDLLLDAVSPCSPAAVILDLNLPLFHGLEVLRRLREHGPTRAIPVVIFSSSAEAKDIVRGYELGANSYIVKPVESKAYSTAVADCARYWSELNQAPN